MVRKHDDCSSHKSPGSKLIIGLGNLTESKGLDVDPELPRLHQRTYLPQILSGTPQTNTKLTTRGQHAPAHRQRAPANAHENDPTPWPHDAARQQQRGRGADQVDDDLNAPPAGALPYLLPGLATASVLVEAHCVVGPEFLGEREAMGRRVDGQDPRGG